MISCNICYIIEMPGALKPKTLNPKTLDPKTLKP